MVVGMLVCASAAQGQIPTAIHQFNFDTDLRDSTGNATGQFVGNCRVENGYLVADGSGSYVQFNQYLIPSTGSVTVAMWVYSDPNQGIHEFISQGVCCNSFFVGRNYAGTNRFRVADQWYATNTEYDWICGAWHHVAVVVDRVNDRTQLWIDGLLKEQRDGAIAITNANSGTATRLCAQYCCGEFFSGKLDDVRIYDSALTGPMLAVLNDTDADGIINSLDNCPTTPNPSQLDCNNNGIGEACETFPDCNSNSLPDSCDISSGTSADADSNGIPDSCQPDCNLNNLPDAWEIATGRATDYNADGIPDTCQGAVMVDSTTDNLGAPSGLATREHSFTALPFAESAVTITIDLIGDLNRVNEYVEVSLNGGTARRFFEADGNDCPATPDRAIITLTRAEFNALISTNGGTGAILVVSMTGSPGVDSSECKNAALTQFRLQYVGIQAKSGDCNGNNRLDIAETHDGTTPDCNLNTVPDSCDIARGAAQDCNLNGVPDACELATTPALDCNTNGIIDSCDLATGGTTVDCDQNGRIDSCQVTETPGTDCNGNLRPDACDIASGTSGDIDHNGTPDECQTVTVPGQYAGIQAAIDAAPASEMRIVSVAAGTYAGPIAFNGKPVIVRGASAASTVIDGASGQTLSVVRFNGGEPAIAALERVTVRGGITGTPIPSSPTVLAGGGIFGLDSAASVRDCVVEQNASGFGAGAYFLRCTGEVRGCTFRNNNASSDGGGFQSNQGSQQLTDVLIENNVCNSRGAGMHLVQGTPTLTRVTVRNNYSNNLIGGVSWYALGDATAAAILDACVVTGNSALVTQGGIGISAASAGVPTISLRTSNVCNNTPRPNISGAWLDLGGNTICDCVGDLTLDGLVNGADLGILLAGWGACTGSCASDLNRDGVVNGADLGVLLAAWGVCGG